MRKIKNALASKGEYNCFGCSPNNPYGLKMEFWEENEELASFFDPGNYYDGWDGIMHGGIIATLMDELGEWLVFVKEETTGVTTKMQVKYRQPVKTNDGKIEIRGKIVNKLRNIVKVTAFVKDKQGNKCAEAELHYYLYPKDVAREKFNFPGRDKF